MSVRCLTTVFRCPIQPSAFARAVSKIRARSSAKSSTSTARAGLAFEFEVVNVAPAVAFLGIWFPLDVHDQPNALARARARSTHTSSKRARLVDRRNARLQNVSTTRVESRGFERTPENGN